MFFGDHVALESLTQHGGRMVELDKHIHWAGSIFCGLIGTRVFFAAEAKAKLVWERFVCEMGRRN